MSDGDAGGGAPAPADSGGGGDSGGGSADSGAAITSAAANNDFGEMAAPYGVNVANHNHDQNHDAALDRPPDLAYSQGRIGASSPFRPAVHDYRPTIRRRAVELDEYFVSDSCCYCCLRGMLFFLLLHFAAY